MRAVETEGKDFINPDAFSKPLQALVGANPKHHDSQITIVKHFIENT